MADYAAGLDLGTTFAGAAVFRSGGSVALVRLEDDEMTSPSAVAPLEGSNGWLVGKSALVEPAKAAQLFKREVGSGTKLHLGPGSAFFAEELLTAQLNWALQRLTEKLGQPPASLTLTHPASWGPHRVANLGQVASSSGIDAVSLRNEPLAAATFFGSQQTVTTGEVVVIYDLGGGTTDISILRKEPEQFVEITNQGCDVGSADFDDQLLEMLEHNLPGNPDEEIYSLRTMATAAKIELSSKDETVVPVTIDGRRIHVPISAENFRNEIRLTAELGITFLQTALAKSGLRTEEISRIYLAGAGAKMPMISELVHSVTGLQPVSPPWPKMSVAAGAALSAAAAIDLFEIKPTSKKSRAEASTPSETQQRDRETSGSSYAAAERAARPSGGTVSSSAGARPGDGSTGPPPFRVSTSGRPHAHSVNTSGLSKGPPLLQPPGRPATAASPGATTASPSWFLDQAVSKRTHAAWAPNWRPSNRQWPSGRPRYGRYPQLERRLRSMGLMSRWAERPPQLIVAQLALALLCVLVAVLAFRYFSG